MATQPTVLIAQQDVLVRMSIAAYLRECGFRVGEAANSDEAQFILEQADLTADVAFIDAGISGTLDGFGLAQWVRQKRPSTQIVMGGTAARDAKQAADLCEQGPTLSKPYDHQLLESHIRQLLAKRQRLTVSPKT